MQTKYRQPLGKTPGCVALVAWFVGCLVGYQCKASIDSIWGKHSLVAWFAGGLLPFLFYPTSFGWCVVGSACLACWLIGFGENTYSDGWIMDKEKNCNCLVCWLRGLLAVDCLRGTVLDGHVLFSICVLG